MAIYVVEYPKPPEPPRVKPIVEIHPPPWRIGEVKTGGNPSAPIYDGNWKFVMTVQAPEPGRDAWLRGPDLARFICDAVNEKYGNPTPAKA